MVSKFSPFAALVLAVSLFAQPSSSLAVPPTDQLLPKGTVGYIAVGDVDVLAKGWNSTQLAQLLDDPAMEPFAEDLRAQLKRKWEETNRSIEISWSDIEQVPSGELAFALVAGLGEEPAALLLADVEDNQPEAKDLLERMADRLKEEKATRRSEEIEGTTVVVYDVPEVGGQKPRRARTVVHFLKDGMLFISDREVMAKLVLERWDAAHEDTLAQRKEFQKVMARCEASAGDEEPHLRWFLEPIAFAEAIRAKRDLNPPAPGDEPELEGGTDMLTVLKHQGFEAIQGVGGHVSFSVGEQDIVHRTATYAPKPWEKSMQMLVFPNGTDHAPQSWVPDDVATYITFYIDMMNAFDNFGPMFDELFGEGETGVWEDVLKSLKEDPNGPGIDLRADLVGHLGNRVTIFTDYVLPITPNSERFVLAIETTDAETLADTIRRSMETDPEVVRREIADHVVWEIVEQEAPVPAEDVNFELELPGADLDLQPQAPPMEEEKRLLPSSAITVAHNHLLIVSHVDFLTEILESDGTQPSLGEMIDYRLVMQELEARGGGEAALHLFSRTDEAYRPTYETLRQGKMPESKSMLASLINAIMGQTEDDPPREQMIDADSLPEFEIVRRYLGPTGAYLHTEDDGWFFEGFLLTKHTDDVADAAGDDNAE